MAAVSLSALAGLLALAAARDLAHVAKGPLAQLWGRYSASRRRTLGAPLPARVVGAIGGAVVAWLSMPVAPGRVYLLLAVAMPLAGFLGPQAVYERRARARHRRLVAALPDALDLLAVSSLAGRSPAAGLADVARSGSGPLAAELRMTVAEIGCGAPFSEALASLRRRVPGHEVASLCASIERSRVLGSPLADQLRRQATASRHDHRRAIEEHAAKAAPKIQLVVALVLVPSVLLMVAAALIVNASTLLGA